MRYRELGIRAANMADLLTQQTRRKPVGGVDSVVLPYEAAMSMKNDLIEICHLLHDLHDAGHGRKD